MNERKPLSEFEQLVLLSVLRLGDEAHGAKLRHDLERNASRSVAVATIYVALARLEKHGLVRSWRSEPRPVRGGKARKYYALLPMGIDALRESKEILERMWEGAGTALDPAQL
ncbi:MAG: PadR family transcriptional regulator [Longimicrobiales bacterium]